MRLDLHVTYDAPAGGNLGRVRVHERDGGGPERAGIATAPPVVRIDVCRCGHAHGDGTPHLHEVEAPEPDWALASAWSWLTRPVDTDELDDDVDVLEPDPGHLPWWDARSSPERRRAMLSLVLLGELQAGVLLRAVWEVVRSTPAGPGA